MIVDAGTLRSNEMVTFDGSAETDGGMFRMFGGQGADVLIGGSGADTIRGGMGGDTLYGNGGNDVFVYRTAAESFTDRDSIQDFTQGDIVDLSRIDANINLDGDQMFEFIGNTGFHSKAGELRFQNHSGNIWLVQGDTDGDGDADFELFLVINDASPITEGDFLP
jgi:Ca2+-binding RTX toxin-like protein